MRRRRIWLIGVGLLVALGCLSLQWGRAPTAEDLLRCSLATLRGTYIFGYEVSCFQAVFEHPRTCWNPVALRRFW